MKKKLYDLFFLQVPISKNDLGFMLPLSLPQWMISTEMLCTPEGGGDGLGKVWKPTRMKYLRERRNL